MMSTLFALLVPFAGCAAMMLLCSRMMRRDGCTTAAPADPAEIARLRDEVADLRSRLEPVTSPDRAQSPVR